MKKSLLNISARKYAIINMLMIGICALNYKKTPAFQKKRESLIMFD